MKPTKNFLPGILLSSVLLLILTLSITGNFLSEAFTTKNQSASVIKSIKTQNIYNISPSKQFPGSFNFNYQFEKTKSSSKEVNFDVPIAPFDDTNAGEFTDFGPIRDAWGYPVKENAFMKKEEVRKQSLNPFKVQKAEGYDPDTSNPGVYNCRANTSVTGYFKAYFEDVALNTNAGFDDSTFGDGRREEACQVLKDMSELLMLDTTTVKPDILFTRSDQPLPPGALAGASSYSGYYSTGADNGSLHKHILTRQDPTPAMGSFDAFIMTNFNGVNWDIDSTLNQNTYDFYTVMWHEMMHALGFRGLLPAVVVETNISQRFGTFDFFSYKDESLQNRFIAFLTNLLNVPVGAPSPWFLTDQVVYQGIKNIVGATVDGIHPVYSPISWQQGSSLSHFDMNRADGEIYVMHPLIGVNTEREIHEHEKEVLCHLGYMVEGVWGCGVPSPVAVDDIVLKGLGDSMCVKPTNNDLPIVNSMLLIYDLAESHIETGDTINFYQSNNCTGPSQLNSYGARSFMFTYGSSTATRKLTYRVRNIATGRISMLAGIFMQVPPLTCEEATPDPNEWICNGGFDGATPRLGYQYSQLLCNPWGVLDEYGDFVLNACQFMNTPDVIHSDSTSFYTVLSGPAPQNTDFPYLRSVAGGREATIMKLTESVVPGEEYVISFDYARGAGVDSSNVKFALVMGTPVDPVFSSSVTLPSLNQLIFDDFVNLEPWVWGSFEQNFIASDEYESLVFFALSDLNDDPSLSKWSLFDNISIRSVNSPPPPRAPVYSGLISGHLYQDLNQNSLYDSMVESRLSGIPVGLFQVGNTTPIQTVATQGLSNLGKYEFTNLPSGQYYVALVGENMYQSVTQPQVSIDPFANHDHMYAVTLANNQIVSDKDFGISLYSGYGCTDKDNPSWSPQAVIDDGSCEGDAIIKGAVYRDLNGNGQKETNEPVVSNAQVGLYIPNQSTPTQVVTTDTAGTYSFADVAVGDRYVALVDESDYVALTSPLENPGLVENYNHVHAIDVDEDTYVHYADFGVVTTGQLADIGIAKYFTDSQVSVIDRMIAWRVDITNNGPHNATNINISDVIPPGLNLVQSGVVGNVTYTANNGTIHIPSLPIGQTTSVTFRVRAPSGTCGMKKNTATLLSLDQLDIHSVSNQSSSSKNFGPCTKPVIQTPSVKLPG